MMTDEELQEAREFEHCQEYEHCNADGIIENLLDHIDAQAKDIRHRDMLYQRKDSVCVTLEKDVIAANHRYMDLQQVCDEQASQIAYWQKCYNDLVELNAKEEGACKLALEAKNRHIAKLTEETERFYQSSRELGDRKKYKT